MGLSRIARGLESSAVTAVFGLALLAGAAPALAAPAVWSQQTPGPGTSVAVRLPVVSVRVVGDKPIYGPTASYIKVDGKYLRDVSIVYDTAPGGGPDMTRAVLSARVHWALADGAHRVDASAFDYGYVRHKTSWTFAVGAPPVVADPQPAPGAIVGQATPALSATVVDSGPISSVVVQVDGATVPSAFAAGVVIAPLSVPLADEAVHTARVLATDAGGLTGELVWSFEVRTRPKMATEDDCAACHTGYPSAHPVDDCVVCHGPGAPVETGYDDPAQSHAPGGACFPCHGDLSGCMDCHGQAFPAVPSLHDLDNDLYHLTTATTCQPCHAKRLTIEHDRPGLTCLTCHTSSDPDVAAAIAAGATDCSACHSGTSGHMLAHESAATGCTDCHSSNLVVEHVANRGLVCDACHASVDPLVTGAIGAADTACAACHPAASDHRALHDSTIGVECADCHGANLVGEHVDARGLTCSACHASADPAVVAAIAAGDLACASCHDFSSHPYVAATHAAQVAADTASGVLRDLAGTAFTLGDGGTMTYAGQACGQCHLMDLYAEHSKPSSSVGPQRCGACHASPRDTFGDWTGTCQQGGCHSSYHTGMASKHYQDFAGQEQGCGQAASGCHPNEWHNDLAAVHYEAWYWGAVFADISAYRNGCRICHSTAAAVPATPANCQACHASRHGAATFP